MAEHSQQIKQPMKRAYIIYLSLFLLFGCGKGENGDIAPDVAVRFEPSIIETKASGTRWSAGDRIGIYMVGAGQVLSGASIVGATANREYVADGYSGLAAASGQTIYLPGSGTKVDFVAYCPYSENIVNYKYPISVANQANPEAIDILYSNNGRNVDKNSASVALNFKHSLSKIIFLITPLDGVDISGMCVKISGMKTTADLYLATGGVIIRDAPPSDINCLTSNNSATASALILPSTVSNCRVTFAVSAIKDFVAEIPDGTIFEPGKTHTFTVTINRQGAIIASSPISDWNTTYTNGGAAQKE